MALLPRYFSIVSSRGIVGSNPYFYTVCDTNYDCDSNWIIYDPEKGNWIRRPFFWTYHVTVVFINRFYWSISHYQEPLYLEYA